MVVLGREAAERFACTPAPVIYDSDIIPFAGGGWIGLPLSTLATRAGNARASNAAGTGALVALTGMVRLESFLQALDGFKGAVREANIKAAQAGYAALMDLFHEGAPHGH